MNSTIFGFGSLLNLESVQASVPDASGLRACYIKGFTRDFSLWDTVGFSETNLDVAGVPFCALDVKTNPDPESKVNGVVFQVSKPHMNKLLERERDYKLIKTHPYDFNTHEQLGECYVFSANKNNGSFDFGSEAQMRYLIVCLQGAKQFGKDFYLEFLKTTFINGKKLSEIPELLK